MGALLETESRRLEADQRWIEIEAAYERMQREDPAGWQEYLGELDDWDAGLHRISTQLARWLAP